MVLKGIGGFLFKRDRFKREEFFSLIMVALNTGGINPVVPLGNKNGMNFFRFNYLNGESVDRVLGIDVKIRFFGENSGIYQGFGFGRTMFLEADSLDEAARNFRSDLGDSMYRDQVRESGSLIIVSCFLVFLTFILGGILKIKAVTVIILYVQIFAF